MRKNLTIIALCLVLFAIPTSAQNESSCPKANPAAPQIPKKINQRSAAESTKSAAPEPFDSASVETMKSRCVKLETDAGVVELELFPESAPESVRNFLNLAATGAFDTTTFSRVVPDFIVQGGNLSTREKMTAELAIRSRRKVPDEPSLIKHERGILSMARPEEPNGATTSFFILVGEAAHLDGKFAAFGRVTSGMETIDAINKMPVEGDKPLKPARLTRATVSACPAPTAP